LNGTHGAPGGVRRPCGLMFMVACPTGLILSFFA
jgi:hypothetical protein